MANNSRIFESGTVEKVCTEYISVVILARVFAHVVSRGDGSVSTAVFRVPDIEGDHARPCYRCVGRAHL